MALIGYEGFDWTSSGSVNTDPNFDAPSRLAWADRPAGFGQPAERQAVIRSPASSADMPSKSKTAKTPRSRSARATARSSSASACKR